MYGTWMRLASFGKPFLIKVSLSAEKHCHGGKNSKERATWAFFVSVSGEKEAPIVVWKESQPTLLQVIKGQFTSP